MRHDYIVIEDTEFQWKTNFACDPDRDGQYKSDKPYGNIVIPDEDLAQELMDEGFYVKCTKPYPGKEDEFVPKYYVKVFAKMDSNWPPKIYIVDPDDVDVHLEDAESLKEIDRLADRGEIENVCVVLNRYYSRPDTEHPTLYIVSMEVYKKPETDPIAIRHKERLNRREMAMTRDEEELEPIPFN